MPTESCEYRLDHAKVNAYWKTTGRGPIATTRDQGYPLCYFKCAYRELAKRTTSCHRLKSPETLCPVAIGMKAYLFVEETKTPLSLEDIFQKYAPDLYTQLITPNGLWPELRANQPTPKDLKALINSTPNTNPELESHIITAAKIVQFLRSVNLIPTPKVE